jgi:hypothetical protein
MVTWKMNAIRRGLVPGTEKNVTSHVKVMSFLLNGLTRAAVIE